MPTNKVSYFNQIDIGIFLFFLELCLEHNGAKYEKEMFVEEDEKNAKNLTAKYLLK